MGDDDRDWDTVRTKGEHFSEQEIAFIQTCGKLGWTRTKVARELKCAIRSVDKYYKKFGFVKKYAFRKPGMEEKPKEKKVLPDRYYHSNFEPS